MGFRIFFHGLVCHRTSDNTSVFIGAPEHELRLVVRNDDVIEATGFDSDPPDDALHLDPRLASHEQRSFRVAGHVLEIDGAVSVDPSFSSHFTRFLPRLRRLANCSSTNLRPEVANRKVMPGLVSGFLVNPGGAYSVHDFFPEKQTMTGFVKDATCVPRTILLDLATNGSPIAIHNQQAGIVLKQDAEVRFTNIMPPFVAGPSNTHFDHYFHAMFDNCHHGNIPMPAGGKQCTHRHDLSFAVPGGDCGNSGDP